MTNTGAKRLFLARPEKMGFSGNIWTIRAHSYYMIAVPQTVVNKKNAAGLRFVRRVCRAYSKSLYLTTDSFIAKGV